MPTVTDDEKNQFLAVVVHHAARALQAGMAENWPAAVSEIHALNAAAGPAGLIQAMAAWIDTALQEAGITEYGGPWALAWQSHETGRITGNADEMRPAVRWAGRLFAARAADDQDMFDALIRAIPQNPDDTGEYIVAVLQSAVLTIQRDSPRLNNG